MRENITYEQASELLSGLVRTQNIRGDIRYNYAWKRNFDRLYAIQKQINRVRFPKETPSDTEMFNKMQKIEAQLHDKGINKDSKGYDKEYAALADSIEAEYPETRDKYRKHAKLFQEFLQEPCDFEFYAIPKESIPENLTEDQMKGLEPFVK